MKKDDGMKKDTMAKDTMKKDDGMKKDEHVQGQDEAVSPARGRASCIRGPGRAVYSLRA